jgi:RND family efflux transporter MFP subunit
MKIKRDSGKRRQRRPAVLVSVVAVFGGIGCSTQSKTIEQTRVVPVSTAAPSDLAQDIVLTAEFTPFQDVDLMAKVAGYVRAIRVDIGDHVREGELLATLEVPEMQNEMAKAEASAKAAQSDVVTAQHNLARAKAAYELADLSFSRIQEVSKKEPGLVPQQDVDVAHSRQLEAAAQLSTEQSSLEAAEERSSVAKAEQDRLKTMYQYTNITAPFAGIITKRYANTGSMIQAGTSSQTQTMPLVRLAQDNVLRLMLPVPINAVPQVHVGQTVDVNVLTLSSTFPGKVTRFANDIQTSTRTMNTEVDVLNPKLTIMPGMYAEVRLHLKSLKGVLSLPLDAVEGLGTETQHVYEVDPQGIIHIITVKVGAETDARVEIVSGIQAGQSFVVGRHTGLVDGMKVTPRQADYDTDHSSQKQVN